MPLALRADWVLASHNCLCRVRTSPAGMIESLQFGLNIPGDRKGRAEFNDAIHSYQGLDLGTERLQLCREFCDCLIVGTVRLPIRMNISYLPLLEGPFA